MNQVIQFPNGARIHGAGRDVIAEVMTITPSEATSWLRCNKNNRPVRRRHVAFLASEIIAGNWQVNGQAIVIADDEQVLDGQHRLLAIIEAGKAIKSLVVYGITPEAFKTIDTGAVRSSSDALILHFPDLPITLVKAAAAAVPWCVAIERGNIRNQNKISNTQIIEYVRSHMSLVQCAETLNSYPHEARPLALGCGTALYELFARKKPTMADEFMKRLYTGEGLTRTDPEYVLRAAFQRDATRVTKLPYVAKVRMVIKGWNWLRRGMTEASHQTIAVQANDDQAVRIY